MTPLHHRILALFSQAAILALGLAALGRIELIQSLSGRFLFALAALLLLGGVYLRSSHLHQQARHSLLRALQQLGTPLLLLDAQRQVVFINPAFLALDQANQQASRLDTFASPWLDTLSQHFQQAMDSSTGSTPEEVLIKPGDGREAMLLRLSATQLIHEDGQHCVLISAENLSAHNQTLTAAIEREHTLRTRTQRYVQTLIDVIPQPVYVKDEAGCFVLVNQTFCARHNLGRHELLGQARQVLDADILRAEEAQHEDLRVMAGTPIFREEHLRSQGQDLYFIISKQSCEDPEGRRVLVGTQVDITPWRIAEQAVKDALERETERRERTQAFVQRLLDVFPNPVCLKDTRSRYVTFNQAFIDSRGRSREELLRLDAQQVAHAVVSEASGLQETALERTRLSLEEDRAVLAGQTLRKEENNIPDQYGVLHDRIVTKTACEDPDGQQLIVVSMFDITDMRNAQRELQAALVRETGRSERIQAFVQRLLDVIPEPVYVKDAAARYVMINEAFASQRRQAREEIIGKSARELAPNPEVAARVLAEDAEVLAGRTIRNIDDTPHPLTGLPRWRIVTKGSCLDPDGQPVIVGANIDITAVREIEQKLAAALATEQDLRQRTQAFVQHLLDAIPLPICVRDRDSRHLQINAKFLEESGLAREQIIGRRITDFIDNPEQVQASLREDREVLAGREIFEEKQDLGLSGKDIRDLIIAKRCCLDVDRQPVIVVAHIDVTAQREAERQALALMANEKSLRKRTQDFIQRMIDVIPHSFFLKDQNSRYILVNAAFLAERRSPAEAILGRTTAEIAPTPQIAEKIVGEDLRVLAGEEIHEERHEIAYAGSQEWVDRIVTKRRCLDVDGKPIIAVSHVDVTHHRKIEHALQQALEREAANLGRLQEFLQHVMDVLPQEFYIKDAESRVLLVNPVYLKRRGLMRPDEAIGKTAPEIGEHYLSRIPALQADPAAFAAAREELHRNWLLSHQEDAEVLTGQSILKRVVRRLPGLADEHVMIIAKAACLDPQGRPVIVCATYDLTDLDQTAFEQRIDQQPAAPAGP